MRVWCRNIQQVALLRLTHFPGIKAKVENKGQYDEYLQELQGVREELGINLKESMYPEGSS